MPDKIRIINVGGQQIGLNLLDEAIDAAKEQLLGRTDEEIATELLRRLEPVNYIPRVARDEYARALVREFHRAAGLPVVEQPRDGLVIKVLGAGCDQCRKLEADVITVLAELGIPAEVEHVTEMKRIAAYGVMGTPALLINGEIKAVGGVPPMAKIKTLLMAATSRK